MPVVHTKWYWQLFSCSCTLPAIPMSSTVAYLREGEGGKGGFFMPCWAIMLPLAICSLLLPGYVALYT